LDRSTDDEPRDTKDNATREDEARRRSKNKRRPQGSTPPDDGPLPGRGPAADARKWLPSGKRGQRSARRAERDRFHPTEETTRTRRGLPSRSPRPKARAGSAPAALGGGEPPGTVGGATRPGSWSRGARRGAAGAVVGAVATWLATGEPPSAGEVVVSVMPILGAENHGETVIPIILMVAGWKVTLAVGGAYAVYKYAEAVQEQPILAVPPAAAGLGVPAHTLGAKGGYGNLLCYPGKPGCGPRRR
jgi:hypothetical protein